jgi:hypothetical protein
MFVTLINYSKAKKSNVSRYSHNNIGMAVQAPIYDSVETVINVGVFRVD